MVIGSVCFPSLFYDTLDALYIAWVGRYGVQYVLDDIAHGFDHRWCWEQCGSQPDLRCVRLMRITFSHAPRNKEVSRVR